MQNIWKSEFYKGMLETLDRDSIWCFAEDFGGQKIYIPSKAYSNHPIAKVYGLELLKWLVEHFGGEGLVVPQGPASFAEKRKRKAYLMVLQNKPSNLIALSLGISYEYAKKLKAEIKQEERTLSNQPSLRF